MDGTTDEFDRPLGGLPGLSRVRLIGTQLEAAIAEIRFVPGVEELPEAVAVAVWEQLGKERFPVFDRHVTNTFNLTFTPDGANSSSQVQHGWLLATSDRQTSITLLPSMIALQTREYERYSQSLGEPFQRALSIFADTTGASIVQRIGLRYINRLQDNLATVPTFWSDRAEPYFAGPLSGPFGHLVESTHQQSLLRLDPNSGARIISGVFREEGAEPRFSFLVDIDAFIEQAFPFDATRCSNLTRQLNRTALALFKQVLSEDYFELMSPADIDEESK